MFRMRLIASTAMTLAAAAIGGAPNAMAQTATPPTTAPAPAPTPDTTVKPFYGRIAPFYGRISPFSGDVSPFWGRISPFWGRISPFEGDTVPFWGRISPFSADIAPFWGRISPFMDGVFTNWSGLDAGTTQYTDLRVQLDQLVTQSETFWGPAVQKATGKNFWDSFGSKVFAKYGLDLNSPASFKGLSDTDRASFLFDWYDGLMNFSGHDHVDHWMGTANWTPALTQNVGSGKDTVIGLIDFTVGGTSGLTDNVSKATGWKGVYEGHGTAVASLLIAPHDGVGLMGIAQLAKVVSYNPFDATGSASWDSLEKGVIEVTKNGASVVNMSLGLPGMTLSPEWMKLYSRKEIVKNLGSTVFVHAAGNDGLVQTNDIAWNFAADPHMIVVGSVGPSGKISAFSNTPGEACLLSSDVCLEQNKLKYRFLVAPGEWTLVDDGKGGTTRVSGTSFAAPIVTGAIALIHDRWTWLKKYPSETVDILFKTATDLGAPGVDPVYGQGLINIGAALEPIDYSKLYLKAGTSETKAPLIAASTAETLLTKAVKGQVKVFEDLGTTYRDFAIPLDMILTGANSVSAGTITPLEAASTNILQPWADAVDASKEKSKKPKGMKFDGGFQPLPNSMGWDVSVRYSPLPLSTRDARTVMQYASQMNIASPSGARVSLGNGVGAMALTNMSSNSAGSFDPVAGGANPVLGLASGGTYANVELPMAGSTLFTFGATERTYTGTYASPFSGEILRRNESVPDYHATAANIGLVQPIGDALTMRATYTYLREDKGVLGVQSTDPTAFASGASTDAISIGGELVLTDRIGLSGIATLGRTRGQPRTDQLLSVSRNGIATSAFEAALNVDGVFGKSDHARLALVQSMHVESGGLDLNSVEVVDRTTGELGATSRFNPANDQARELSVEIMYALPALGGQFAGFVRADIAGASGDGDAPNHMLGGQYSIRY